MLQSLFEKHILRLNLTQISPTHIHPLFQNKEASLGKNQRFSTIQHIRFQVDMQKYIIALIIEHRQQYLQKRQTAMSHYQKCMFHCHYLSFLSNCPC